MSLEAEIKALIKSSKIGILMKKKLIVFGCRKDNEFRQWLHCFDDIPTIGIFVYNLTSLIYLVRVATF